ncbi:TonB-dependent receptor [bacterium]|nr:TonB-dependent receptor [bacterium]
MRRMLVAVSISAVSGGAFAQGATPSAQPVDETIVVTGLGPDRPGGELIQSTTVLREADVIDRLAGGLGDTLAGLPGVSSTSFGPGASRPVVRGLGAERVQVLVNGIGVIDASAASPDHAVTADPLGAQRIEVLRGAASLAYGGGAAGGVINVIDGLIPETRLGRPFAADGYAGWTSVDEGTTAAARVQGQAGGVVGVLRASRRDLDEVRIPGFVESAALRAAEAAEGEEHEQESGRLPNSFSESDDLSAGVSFVGDRGFFGASVRRGEATYGLVGGHGHEEEEEGLAVASIIAGKTPGAVFAPAGEGDEEESPFIKMEQTRFDVRGGASFGGLVRRIAGAVSVVDYEHTEFEAPGEPGTLFTNEGVEGRFEVDHRAIGGFEGSVGLQASSRDFAAVGDEAFVTPTETSQVGVFLYESYETPEFGVEGGLRFDTVDLANQVNGDRSFDTFNASAGVHGHVSEAVFLGLSLSRTERAPTDVELFADGPHLATRQFEVGNLGLSTEKGVNVEATARWTAGPLSLEATVFRYDFDGFIYLSPTGDEEDELPVFETLQNDAEFTGAEVSAAYRFGERGGIDWTLDGSADVVEASLSGGGPLPRIPPASARIGLEAQRGALSGRLDLNWAADQDDVASFELPTDGYTTLDARLNIAINEQVTLIIAGTNLTDEEVRLHTSPLKDFAPQPGRGVRIALRGTF